MTPIYRQPFGRTLLVSALMAGAVSLAMCTWARGAEAYGIERHVVRNARVDANGNRILLGGRPAGCPHAYCGCGLGRYLGKTDRRLWLAWNWALTFQRVHARPGAVAVRRHHVMLLESHVGGSRWIVRDFNGGRHLSWLHERDVRGYVFVDPNARADAR